ncbi:MAG: hypothetical protein HYY49_11825 [Ignavibacteriales bacterium]|nr:hypothetical protein [Ignavibacteriales bacterium]
MKIALKIMVLSVLLISPLFAQTKPGPESIVTSVRTGDALDLKDLNLPDGQVAGLIRHYAADRGSLNRFYSAPYSPVRRGRFKQLYAEWLAALRSLNFESLSQPEKVDYLLFKNYLDHDHKQSATSDDIVVDHYHIMTGKKLK